ncbi:TatD family hydrolase [bacterium]|nr:TatD family hydrolase [bacterium]
MILDAHFHLKQLLDVSLEQADFIKENDFLGFCSCRKISEVEFVENFISQNPEAAEKLKISFGIHPQAPDEKDLQTLEKLIAEKRISAVGEIGLDRFDEEFAKTFELQKKLFAIQLEIAETAGLPVILHIRKAIPEIFEQIQILKKIRKVIFHSYSGTAAEAESILNHGVNAYFSFGNALLNGHKKAAETVKTLPEDRILTETDAPYQPKKGENFSKPQDILEIEKKIREIKRETSQATFGHQLPYLRGASTLSRSMEKKDNEY